MTKTRKHSQAEKIILLLARACKCRKSETNTAFIKLMKKNT